MAERMFDGPDQGGHRRAGTAHGRACNRVVLRGAEGCSGVHGTSSNHDHFGHVY